MDGQLQHLHDEEVCSHTPGLQFRLLSSVLAELAGTDHCTHFPAPPGTYGLKATKFLSSNSRVNH